MTVDMSLTLAEKMTAWSNLRMEADALEKSIKAEVLALQQTVTHGSVRATFNHGRKTYDYKSIAEALEFNDDQQYARSKWVTDWERLCDDLGLDDDPEMADFLRCEYHKQARPSVSLKLQK